MTAEDTRNGLNQHERDLDAELRFDFDQRVAEKIRAGMNEAQARRATRLEFGGIEQVKEECRDARGARLFESLRRDVSYALRLFARAPGFTAVAVAILAVGIGINAAVFTLTNTVLFGGYPLVKDNNRLLYITTNGNCCISYADFEDFRGQAQSFEDMALTHGIAVTLTDLNGFAEAYAETQITSNTFRLVGQQPVLGRDFTPADEIPGAAPVAILRYGLWVSRFARDPNIVGRRVRLNGEPATIIGVMPEGFSFPQNEDLWAPVIPTTEVKRRDNRDTWFAFGRLRNGVSPAAARAEIETIGRRLETAYPGTNRHMLPVVSNFREFFIGSTATAIYQAMWVAVGFVLLIACANLANMLLSRAASRSREISMRVALGAGQWRVVRQLLIESVMLAGMGGLAGWWVAKAAMGMFAAALNGSAISVGISGTWFDDVMQYQMDYRVFAYLLAVSVGTGLLFGFAPASRLARVDVNDALKDQARGTFGGRSGKRWSTALAVAELAIAVVLLAGAGVMIRSFLNVYRADLGFNATNIGTTSIYLPTARYGRVELKQAFFDRLTRQLRTLPEIESASLANSLPGQSTVVVPYEIDGAPQVSGNSARQLRPRVARVIAGEAFFRTLGLKIIAGREFDDRDGIGKVAVATVNQLFAERNWPGESPVGKRLRIYQGDVPDVWLTVVGVAPNVAAGVQQEFVPLLYVPYAQAAVVNTMTLITHSRVPMGRLETDIRREVKAIDPELAVNTPTLIERLSPVYRFRGVIAALFLVFAAIALLLASIGLYAVMADAASRRTQEIGIRMALGASGRDIKSLVFRQGMLPLLIGLIAGLVASLGVNRLLRSQLVAVSPFDPATYAVTIAVLMLAAALGCWIPARRAVRVDPAVALRHE